MPRDLYEVLEVQRDASDEDIRNAFRRLARQNHPDRNPNNKQAEARYHEVLYAYDVLSDKNRRQQYDRHGAAGPPAVSQWGNGAFNFQSTDANDLAELLKQFGVDVGGAGTRDTGPALTIEVPIPHEMAMQGGVLPLRVNELELAVKVPAGIKEGQMMRLGGVGPGGADLFVKLHVQPRSHFQREGNDLVLEVPLSLPEAVLGTKIDVPTPDGAKLPVMVPPGASSLKRLRLAGKGSDGGDQLIQLKILAPAARDDRSREIIAEYSRLNPHQARPRVGSFTPDAQPWDHYWLRESKPPVLRLPLSLPEAVLGTEVAVPLVDGTTIPVKVLPGAASGERQPLRRQERGGGLWAALRRRLSRRKGAEQGDLFLQLEIVTLAPQDDRSRVLIEEFGRLNPQQPRTGAPWS